MKKYYTLLTILSAIVSVVLLTSGISAQGVFPPWNVPETEASVANPTPDDKNSRSSGLSVYNANCKSCHGEKGLGNGIIPAANLSTIEFQQQTDGAMFYKLKQGRGTMPSFKALPENDLWHVIHFIRTLSVTYKPVAKKQAILYVRTDEKNGKKHVYANVSEKDASGNRIPISNAKLKFAVKRYFGELPVSNDAFSNSEGNAGITLNDSTIIGDKVGNLVLMVKLDDMDYESTPWSDTLQWGVANTAEYWTERRALWKNNDYIPIWLLVTFGGILSIVFGVILYVLLLLRKIKKLSETR